MVGISLSYACGLEHVGFFFSPMPLLLAYGTMGIEMAIAPLWVKGKRKMTESSKMRTKLYSEKCHMSGKPNTCCAASQGQKQPST